MFKKYALLLFISIVSAFTIIAQTENLPERPSPARLVNNLSSSGFISASDEARLEEKLQAFANETSNQIVIVIVDDLAGMEPYQYATELGQKWGVGQKEQDNGIVILVKPTGGKGERQLFIAPGYGLQGAIPDLTTKQIREDEMMPSFQNGKGYEGLDKGTDVLMALAKGEYNSDAYGEKHKGGMNKWKLGLLLLVFIIFIIIKIKGGGRSGNGMSMGTGFFLGSMFSGGRGFGGGGSSGGFGGFGGGGFGGGGSGGSW